MNPNWHPAVAAAQGQERLLRTEQAAARLKMTPQRVTQLCREGILAGIKVSQRKWLISESAIRDYLDTINQE